MSFYDQLKLVRGSNIIIGVHGAGLMFIMFAAEEVRNDRTWWTRQLGVKVEVEVKSVDLRRRKGVTFLPLNVKDVASTLIFFFFLSSRLSSLIHLLLSQFCNFLSIRSLVQIHHCHNNGFLHFNLQAILVELHPSYRQDRHFRHAARMTGKIYMPLRSQQRCFPLHLIYLNYLFSFFMYLLISA